MLHGSECECGWVGSLISWISSSRVCPAFAPWIGSSPPVTLEKMVGCSMRTSTSGSRPLNLITFDVLSAPWVRSGLVRADRKQIDGWEAIVGRSVQWGSLHPESACTIHLTRIYLSELLRAAVHSDETATKPHGGGGRFPVFLIHNLALCVVPPPCVLRYCAWAFYFWSHRSLQRQRVNAAALRTEWEPDYATAFCSLQPLRAIAALQQKVFPVRCGWRTCNFFFLFSLLSLCCSVLFVCLFICLFVIRHILKSSSWDSWMF